MGETFVVHPTHLCIDSEFYPKNIRSQGEEEILPLASRQTLREAVDEYRKLLIQRAVAKHRGNWAAAARDLGMHRSNLHNLAIRLGLRTTGS